MTTKDIVHKAERLIILALLAMMMVALLASTVELGIILVQQLLEPPFLLLNVKEMLTVFAFFLMVLIGLELFETVKMYFEEDIFHVEVVVLVAIIAVARKIIVIDYKTITYEMLLSLAAIILALTIGYFLIKRAETPSSSDK
jgi:uncharacterized membrane protein (DUF373 family)